jgi:hypothetical protein
MIRCRHERALSFHAYFPVEALAVGEQVAKAAEVRLKEFTRDSGRLRRSTIFGQDY